MDYLSYNVAVNLKQIRLSKGMSLGEVAEQTGVSKSMLAQIEKGTANPSLGVLGKRFLPCKSKRNFSYKRTGRAI